MTNRESIKEEIGHVVNAYVDELEGHINKALSDCRLAYDFLNDLSGDNENFDDVKLASESYLSEAIENLEQLSKDLY